MKKILLLISLVLCIGQCMKAQTQPAYINPDCDDVVLANYNYRDDVLDILAEKKYQIICNWSRVAFAYAEQAPEGAIVIDAYSLFDIKTQTKVDASYTDDAVLCNYYRFGYETLQCQQGLDKDIYIRLHNGTHAYLLLHNYYYIHTHQFDGLSLD